MLGNVPLPEGYNGNIDLNNRKVYRDPRDGHIETEYSMDFAEDPGDQYSIRIPTVIDGNKAVDADAAINHFRETGRHLGYNNRADGESKEAFYNRVEGQSNDIHLRQQEAYKAASDPYGLGDMSVVSKQLRGLPLSPEQSSFEEAKREAGNMVPEEAGLIDVSAFVVPRAIWGSVFKNPVFGPTMKRIVPDPKLFRAARKLKGSLLRTGMVGGAGAAVASEFLQD